MGKRRGSAKSRYLRLTGGVWILFAAMLAIIICSQDHFAAPPQTETVTGVYEEIRTVLSGKSTVHWEIVLQDGSVLKASRTAGFDPDRFGERVRKGERLSFGTADGWIWEIRDEAGAEIHSMEESLNARRESGAAVVLISAASLAGGLGCFAYGCLCGKRRKQRI